MYPSLTLYAIRSFTRSFAGTALPSSPSRVRICAATSIESCLSFARNVQEFTARPVGTGVNDPRRDDAALVEPLASAIPA